MLCRHNKYVQEFGEGARPGRGRAARARLGAGDRRDRVRDRPPGGAASRRASSGSCSRSRSSSRRSSPAEPRWRAHGRGVSSVCRRTPRSRCRGRRSPHVRRHRLSEPPARARPGGTSRRSPPSSARTRASCRPMAGAMRGKEKLEEAVGRVLRQMNVPTRSELKRAVARIEALEKELAARQARRVPKRRAERAEREGSQAAAQGGRLAACRAIALTGTASFLGGRLLRRLVSGARRRRGAGGRHHAAAHDAPGRAPPHGGPDAARRGPPAARGVPRGGGGHRLPRGVLHDARGATPAYSHELESIGTLHLAAAAAAAGVRHLVLRSFTAVYGARGQNPSFLTEDKRPRRRTRGSAGCATRLEAEEHASSFARRYPGLRGDRAALRAAAGARRPHLLHAASSASAWCRC